MKYDEIMPHTRTTRCSPSTRQSSSSVCLCRSWRGCSKYDGSVETPVVGLRAVWHRTSRMACDCAEDWDKEGEYFQELSRVKRKLKFDYLNWVSTFRILCTQPLPASPERCSPGATDVHVDSSFNLKCSLNWIVKIRAEKRGSYAIMKISVNRRLKL